MKPTVGAWIGGLAEWTEGDTAYLSIAFSYRLNDAYQRAIWYRAQGFRVVAGGPGIFTRKHFLADVAEIGREHPDAVARHNPMATFASRGCDVGCWFCLPPDGLIISADGLKRIADVHVGEMVLTHRGRYRPVVKTMARPYSGPLAEMNSGALSQIFRTRLTPEHPVYTRRVSMPSGGARLREFEWTDAGAIVPQRSRYARDVFAFPRTKEILAPKGGLAPGLPSVAIDAAFMRLLGWYVAEGYVTTAPGRGAYRVTFCLGHSEVERQYAEEIVGAAAVVGLRAKSRLVKIGYRVMIHNVELCRWLLDQFGTGASDKLLPLWLRLLSPDLLQPFVDAWVKGDGWAHVKKGTNTWKVTTVSPHLATGLREIALKLGFSATINRHHQNDRIQGRKVNIKDAFTVIFHERRDRPSITGDADYVYSRIQQSADEHYEGLVHNIEVAEDNSYCTPAFAVHNCVVPKMEGRIFTELPDFPVRPVLCDNNLSGLPAAYQDHIVSRYQATGVPLLDANSGFEPRTFDDEVYARWRPINRGPWRFAFDEQRERSFVERVMRMLAAETPKRKRVYVLIGNEPVASCIERIREVMAWGGEPYVQRYMKLNALERKPHIRFDWSEQLLRDVARWANSPMIWRKTPFEDYRRSVKTKRMERYDAQEGLFR